MKQLFLSLIFCFFLSSLEARELDLSLGRLRNTRGRIEGNKILSLSPSRSAEIFFQFRKTEDFSPFNRVRVELTPVTGKFIKRNFVLSFFTQKETARFRPQGAPGGLVLKNGQKTVLEYILPGNLKNITALRLFFNRTEDRTDRSFLLHKIEFHHAFTPRKMGDFRHKVNTKTCVLLADDDRGHTPQEARFEDFGQRKQPRPTPIAIVPGADQVTGKGQAVREKIPVELLDETGFDRRTQLRLGVPFARKTVFSLKNLCLRDEKGRPVPAVFSAFSRYEDGSLRHLFVTADVSLKAHEKKVWHLEYGHKVTAIPVKTSLACQLKNDVLTVDNGRLKAKIPRKNFNFLQALTVDGRPAGKFLPLEIVMADGKKYTLADPERFELIENTPLRVTLRASGNYTGLAGSYVCRITFKNNDPAFEVEFTHINSVLEKEFTDYKSLALRFAPAEKIICRGRFFQETDQEYTRSNGAKVKGRLSGAFQITRCLGLAVADFWQRYPKAVTCTPRETVIELLPEQPDKKFNSHLPLKLSYLYTSGCYRMKWGMSFTERITFDFNGFSPEKLAASRQKPLIAVLPFEYYRKAGFAPDDQNLSPVDAAITKTFDRYMARQEREREYGFFNYGDSFGERGHSWTNNEYDPVHGMLKTYLRTGNRDLLRYGIVSARHQADVDTCHAYPNDYFVGANLQHAVGHAGVGRRWSRTYTRYTAASNGHSWVRGRLLVWLLTGDTLVMDSCYMFGDHTAFAVVPNYKTILGKAPRETGWMLRALTALFTVTRRPEYFQAAQTMAKLAVKECAFDKGAWPRVIRRLNASFKEKTLGNNNFQVAVMLRGLCDYYRIDPDPEVKRAIISSARWLAKGFNPGNSAGFNYDIDIHGRGLNWPVSQLNNLIAPPLAEAALLADDPALFTVARKAFARVLLARHPIEHKTFAMEWTFLHDYLRAEALWNKKYNKKSDYSRENQLKIFYGDTVPQWRVRGSSQWEIISCAADARISLRRWIRSGRPQAPVRLVLRDEKGKILTEKQLPPNLLRQDVPLVLPGKKGTRFLLEITDSFSGDWSMGENSQALYAVRMPGNGIPVAHNGLHRFFAEIPAGKSVEVIYAGSHVGEWYIVLTDGGKKYRKEAFAPEISLNQFRKDAARFQLPVSPKKRLIYMDCFSGTDARILIRGVKQLSADQRFFAR